MFARIRKTLFTTTVAGLAIASTAIGTAFLAALILVGSGNAPETGTLAKTKVEQKAETVAQPTSTVTPTPTVKQPVAIDGQIVHTGYDYQNFYNGIISESGNLVSIEFTNTKPISPIHKIVKFNFKTAKIEEIATQNGKTYTFSDSTFTYWIERDGEKAVLHINTTKDDGTLVKANAYVITWKSSRLEEGVKGSPLKKLQRFEYDENNIIKVEGEVSSCLGFTNVPVALNPQFGKFDLDGDGVACKEQVSNSMALQQPLTRSTPNTSVEEKETVGINTDAIVVNKGGVNCRYEPNGNIKTTLEYGTTIHLDTAGVRGKYAGWDRLSDRDCWVKMTSSIKIVELGNNSQSTAYTPEEAELEGKIVQSTASNCRGLRAEGYSNINVGANPHLSKLDRDKDGIACEQ
jgi:hypothetical protein